MPAASRRHHSITSRQPLFTIICPLSSVPVFQITFARTIACNRMQPQTFPVFFLVRGSSGQKNTPQASGSRREEICRSSGAWGVLVEPVGPGASTRRGFWETYWLPSD